MVLTTPDYRSRVLKSLGQLPPFSPVLNKLLATLAREDVPYMELAGIIEKDTVMSGNVLRLVNSAAFARRTEITSIPHAISVMGLAKLRNMVLGLSISRMWAGVKMPKSWSAARFNMHSVATAVMADNIAQHVSTNYPEGAFIAGLLHDFGKLLIAAAMPAEAEEIERMAAETGRPALECEREIVGADHADLSAIALKEWNLPVPVQIAVEYHHDPQRNVGYLAEVGKARFHLADIVRAASESVNRLGVTVAAVPPDFTPHANPTEPVQSMTDEETTWKIVGAFEKEFEAIRAFF
jgi:HD-like signal output (HDOD) protein